MIRVYRYALVPSTLVLLWLLCGIGAGWSGAAGVARLFGIPLPASAQRTSQIPPTTEPEPSVGPSAKQRRELMKANFEKMQREGDELADLAKSLQEDLKKANQNVLSLHIVEKADKIEKLAKKIKSEAKGF